MPLPSTPGQPDSPGGWFSTAAGQALLESEAASVHDALAERPAQAWLWLAPVVAPAEAPAGRGLRLRALASGWQGAVRCALPLPLANESVATVVVQHVTRGGEHGTALLSECARVLVPGGRLWLFALNPLSPYRWRWNGNGLRASEPMPWRRRLRAAGMHPDAVSQGLGPRWRIEPDPRLQHGPGLRAAWLLRAEKRAIPLTAVRTRAPLRIGGGVPAA